MAGKYINLIVPDEVKEVVRAVRNEKVSVFGADFSVRAHIASQTEGFFLFVTADFLAAKKLHAQLKCYDDGIVFLPARPDALSFRQSLSAEISEARNAALYDISCFRARGAVVTAEALAQIFAPKELFAAHVIPLIAGAEYKLGELVRLITSAGYRRETLVGAKGEFSSRGDILDIFPVNRDNPYRLEFFGDTLESIRIFDPESQKSAEACETLEIVPRLEFFGTDGEIAAATEKYRAAGAKYTDAAGALYADRIAELELKLAGGRDECISFLAPLLPHTGLEDYLPENTVMIYDECKLLTDTLNLVYGEHNARMARLIEGGEICGYAERQLHPRATVLERFAPFKQLAFFKITSQNNIFTTTKVINIRTAPVTRYASALGELTVDLKRWLGSGYKVMFCCRDRRGAESFRRTLKDEGFMIPIAVEGGVSPDDPGVKACILPEELDTGFCYIESKLVCIGTYDMFTRKSTLKRSGKDVFLEVKTGDYVVHAAHGIGRAKGVAKLGGAFGERDYIVIEYRDGDILYVPTDQSDMLSRYTGGGVPRLNKMGGAEFMRVKNKVKASVKALAVDLLKLYAERAAVRGYAYSPDDNLLRQFSDSFGHTETDDQLTAVEDIKADMRSGKIMDRLLCGDVGYGKTEVAFRAAFLTVIEGKQAAVLAPTTILTEQHFNTATARFLGTGIRVAVLNRFRAASEQKEILARLAAGEIDIIIGTHRLLSKDVKFHDPGLLVLDEEQRFGVADKEKIKELKKNINVLTMTATPIPRTLHMSLSGIRDISVLEIPPAERLPVQTYVTEYTEATAADAIMREVSRGGQVFVVYNRVDTIDAFAARLRSILPEGVRIITGHGQQNEALLENVIKTFYDGGAEVLVSTTIIENGIDLARANTLIVYDADKMGLAQLYQLRGRVGRSNRLAYAYFCYRAGSGLSGDSYKRLAAILEHTELGSGFKIAMRDLEIRGAGDVLGREQHGHMEKVGYDLYCKLLSESVAELRGGAVTVERECRVDADLSAYIPAGYIEDEAARMRFYARTAGIRRPSDRETLLREITDIYGAPEKSVVNLVSIGLYKGLGIRAGASHIVMRRASATVTFYELTPKITAALEAAGDGVLKMQAAPTAAFDGANVYERVFAFLMKAAG